MDAFRCRISVAAVAVVVLSGVALCATTSSAQGAERVINGHVVRPSGDTLAGVPNAWVVLHRVGTDRAGPLDSVRTRANGAYRFRYRVSGDTSAVYFVSTSRGGVAYFTPPLAGNAAAAATEGGLSELVVYDTTSAAIPITVLGRHVIVTAPDSSDAAGRNVVEVYEISNESMLTRVAGEGGATFEAPLPVGVTDAAIGDGDISMNAIAVMDGRVRISAPLAPGIKQFSFYYRIPVSDDPLTYVVEGELPVLEVLVEDPRGSVSGAGLVEVSPAVVDGRPFKRFIAQDPSAGLAFTVTAPGTGQGGLRVMLIVTAVGAAMLLGLGMTFMRKGPAAFARRRDGDPESLALAVAALDARFEAIPSPTKEQRARHYVERAQLKGRLSTALARRDELG